MLRQFNCRVVHDECVIAVHDEAERLGIVMKGPAIVPDLLPLGRRAVSEYMSDRFLILEYEDHPEDYNFMIMCAAADFGIVLADRWYRDRNELEEFSADLINRGPVKEAWAIVSRKFSDDIMKDGAEEFLGCIFAKLSEMNSAVPESPDKRAYTFTSMLAVFQLGISVILEKYGL